MALEVRVIPMGYFSCAKMDHLGTELESVLWIPITRRPPPAYVKPVHGVPAKLVPWISLLFCIG
jgi:hypothetical protein